MLVLFSLGAFIALYTCCCLVEYLSGLFRVVRHKKGPAETGPVNVGNYGLRPALDALGACWAGTVTAGRALVRILSLAPLFELCR